jgi:hypothetical protein
MNEDVLDLLKLTAMVNNEGKMINSMLTDGHEKLGFKSIIPNLNVPARKSGEQEIVPPQAQGVALIPPPQFTPPQQTLPQVMQMTPQVVDKSQMEFEFVEAIKSKKDVFDQGLKTMYDMLNVLQSIDSRFNTFNKLLTEMVSNMPKRRRSKPNE